MKLVVDTNLVFSAILNTNSNIGDIILNSGELFTFYSCHFLWHELEKHQDKLVTFSKKSLSQILEIEHLIYNKIHFIDEEQIPKEKLIAAMELVKDTDINDTVFIALNEYIGSLLWTGDKKLIKGLHIKGYQKVITTEELGRLRVNIEKGG